MRLRLARKIERRGGSLNARTNAKAARRLFQWDGWRWPIRVVPKKSRDAMLSRRMSKHLCHVAEQGFSKVMALMEDDMRRYSWSVDVLSFCGTFTADELMGKEPDGEG